MITMRPHGAADDSKPMLTVQGVSDSDSVEHCYFPEWADRPAGRGSLHETDRNSYLAGGYAEEFGHRAETFPDEPAAASAEEDGEWRVQMGCLHAGYPDRPRPLDRQPRESDGRAGTAGRPSVYRADRPQRKPPNFSVVLVGQDEGRPRHHSWTLFREFRLRRSRLLLG